MTDKEGVAVTEFTRDAMGNATEELAFDVAGKPVLTKEGWCRDFYLRRQWKSNRIGLFRHERQTVPGNGRLRESDLQL